MFNKLITRLPDNYKKNKSSNIGKLYQIYSRELEQIKKVFKDIKDSRDIDKATNKTLDKIGKNVLELRGTDDDDLYRQMIKTKIIANLSQGDIETINEVAGILIGNSFIGVRETWKLPQYSNEVAGLALTMRNQAKLLDTNAIDRAVAGGIGVKYILELKQNKSEFYIATVFVSGENITVYPYSPKDIESSGKVYFATGNSGGIEKTTVYPRKDVI